MKQDNIKRRPFFIPSDQQIKIHDLDPHFKAEECGRNGLTPVDVIAISKEIAEQERAFTAECHRDVAYQRRKKAEDCLGFYLFQSQCPTRFWKADKKTNEQTELTKEEYAELHEKLK